jgi:hypothetical protein
MAPATPISTGTGTIRKYPPLPIFPKLGMLSGSDGGLSGNPIRLASR